MSRNNSYIGDPKSQIRRMATGEKKAAAGTKRSHMAAPSSTRRKPGAKAARGTARSHKDEAISKELAPAVAIALLEQADHGDGQAAPALEPLAAGAVTSDTDGKLRVQLLFENGAVLPVEMTDAAAKALGKGIAKELQKS